MLSILTAADGPGDRFIIGESQAGEQVGTISSLIFLFKCIFLLQGIALYFYKPLQGFQTQYSWRWQEVGHSCKASCCVPWDMISNSEVVRLHKELTRIS